MTDIEHAKKYAEESISFAISMYNPKAEIIAETACLYGLTYKSDQLTKAKEIIKKFSEFVNNEIEYDPEHPQEHTDLWNKLCEEAEQFLKEE